MTLTVFLLISIIDLDTITCDMLIVFLCIMFIINMVFIHKVPYFCDFRWMFILFSLILTHIVVDICVGICVDWLAFIVINLTWWCLCCALLELAFLVMWIIISVDICVGICVDFNFGLAFIIINFICWCFHLRKLKKHEVWRIGCADGVRDAAIDFKKEEKWHSGKKRVVLQLFEIEIAQNLRTISYLYWRSGSSCNSPLHLQVSSLPHCVVVTMFILLGCTVKIEAYKK